MTRDYNGTDQVKNRTVRNCFSCDVLLIYQQTIKFNMTEINITEMTKRPREIFTAQFDRYDFERRYKRIYFKNIKNDKGVLIKERFWISESKGKKHNLINNMFEDEVIFFSAEIEMNVAYEDGFKLVRPIVLIQKK